MTERDDDHLLDPQQRDAGERPCTAAEHADEIVATRSRLIAPGTWISDCARCGSALLVEVPDVVT